MRYRHLFFALITVLLSACEVTDVPEIVDELVVEAYLHPGYHLQQVRFSRVIPFGDQENIMPPETLQPYVIAGDTNAYLLAAVDSLGTYENREFLLESGQKYQLEVDYNGQMLTAETYIPGKPRDLWISDTLIRRQKIRDFNDIGSIADGVDPIEVRWKNEGSNYYFVSIRNLERNPEVINELFTDSGVELPEATNEPSISDSYVINNFQFITHYGQYEVIVYRVNPEYAVLYSNNTSGQGSLNEVVTNVENGYGIFTGINSDTLYFEVVR